MRNLPKSAQLKLFKILMTGGSGFIGRHLSAHLRSAGHEVFLITRPGHDHELSCSLTDSEGLSRIFRNIQPDILIHLAARPRPGRELDDLGPQYSDTVMPALVLARVAPKSLKLALYFGSCEEYGNGPTPFHEEQAPRAFSPYGWGKIAAHQAVSLIARQHDVSWCWARPFLTFGPGQENDQLVPTLIRGCLSGAEIPLSEGKQTRDFVYVDDLCKMVSQLLLRPDLAHDQVINLASGQPRSVRSVAELIRKEIGSGTLRFGALPYRINEAMSFFASTEKFEKLFGRARLTPFEEAIRATISAYRADERKAA